MSHADTIRAAREYLDEVGDHPADPETAGLIRALAARCDALERAYRQACTNLATIRPDLTRDLSIGETADLYYDALLAGWGGIEGWPPLGERQET